MVRSLMTNTESMICFKDLEGRFLLVNQRWMSLFDVQLIDILGKQHYGDYTEELAEKSNQSDLQVQKQKGVMTFEERFNAGAGDYQFYTTKFPVFDNDSQLIGTGTISVDPSSQKIEGSQPEGLRDPVTGVLNQNAFFEMAGYEFVRRGRYHQQLSMLLVEIEDFNKIKQLHGTKISNKILIEFAVLLEDLLRDTDILFRIGDAKFAVTAPETGGSGGTRAAKRIREAVNEKDFVPVEMITLSIGVVEVVSEDDLKSVLKSAELALSEAKAEGKNRIVIGSA